MSLRDLPLDFSKQAVAAIDARLSTLQRQNGVSVLLAVESGSRAWGFPSPDSDYDCRFVFVRPVDQYLSPWQQRDVIETPLDEVLDVNGWELGKALKLFLKGNAVIVEWLRSPIVYCGDLRFRDEFLAFARRFANRDLIGRHYLHLGERQRRTYFGDGKSVEQKKIFYALRPAATLRWLRLRPAEAIAPMHFPTLMQECDPPGDVASVAAALMDRKARSRELGVEPVPESIARFIDEEFEIGRELFGKQLVQISDEAKQGAAIFFRETARRHNPSVS